MYVSSALIHLQFPTLQHPTKLTIKVVQKVEERLLKLTGNNVQLENSAAAFLSTTTATPPTTLLTKIILETKRNCTEENS